MEIPSDLFGSKETDTVKEDSAMGVAKITWLLAMAISHGNFMAISSHDAHDFPIKP